VIRIPRKDVQLFFERIRFIRSEFNSKYLYSPPETYHLKYELGYLTFVAETTNGKPEFLGRTRISNVSPMNGFVINRMLREFGFLYPGNFVEKRELLSRLESNETIQIVPEEGFETYLTFKKEIL
jgi:hypothetical protein